MALIDPTPWSARISAAAGADGRLLLLMPPPPPGGGALRMHLLQTGDLDRPLDPDSLPVFGGREGGAAAVLGVATDRCGCSLMALFSDAWEVLEPGGRFWLLRPERMSWGRAPDQERRLAELAQNCAFRRVGHHGGGGGRDPLCLDEFVRLDDQRWRVGHASGRHQEAVRRLFREVFHHEISQALWDWKYGEGRGCGTLVWQGERLVAHYGIISRPLRLLGADARVWLVGDVMVEPRERAVLAKKGPFFMASTSCNDACLVFDGTHRLAAGFPNRRHMRLAERTGVYTGVGSIGQLTWDLEQAAPSPVPKCIAVDDRVGRLRKWTVGRLWRRMARDLSRAVVIRRDWDYLVQRYLRHPVNDYRVLLAGGRFGLGARGVVVLRPLGETWELMDLIGPLRNIPVMVEAAKAAAREGGASALGAWIAAGYTGKFLATGCRESDPEVTIPTSATFPEPDPETIRGRWWMTYGDTDFH